MIPCATFPNLVQNTLNVVVSVIVLKCNLFGTCVVSSETKFNWMAWFRMSWVPWWWSRKIVRQHFYSLWIVWCIVAMLLFISIKVGFLSIIYEPSNEFNLNQFHSVWQRQFAKFINTSPLTMALVCEFARLKSYS